MGERVTRLQRADLVRELSGTYVPTGRYMLVIVTYEVEREPATVTVLELEPLPELEVSAGASIRRYPN